MDVLSYSCSHVSFFSLSLSVRISPGLVPEARVCVFWSWDLWTVKILFLFPESGVILHQITGMKEEEDEGGGGEIS